MTNLADEDVQRATFLEEVMNHREEWARARNIFGRQLDPNNFMQQLRALEVQQMAEERRLKRIHNQQKVLAFLYKILMVLALFTFAQDSIESAVVSRNLSVSLTLTVCLTLVAFAVAIYYKLRRDIGLAVSVLLFTFWAVRIAERLTSPTQRSPCWYIGFTKYRWANIALSLFMQILCLIHYFWIIVRIVKYFDKRVVEARIRHRKQKMIGILPRITFHDYCSMDDSEKSCCPICIEDFEKQDDIVRLADCGHTSHFVCLRPWIVVQKRCPVCRTPVRGL